MKLIIDIPEKVVTAIQNGEDYRYDIHTAIAQGVPYEEVPQGELINREALKKAFLNHSCTEFEIKNMCRTDEHVIALIDNAPTAEPHYVSDLPDDVVKTLQTLAIDYSDGIAIFERKRPQGEWICHSDSYITFYTCNRCNGFGYKDDKFCNNCGAEMKEGAE